MHRIGVHDPRHGLFIGAHVGRHDIHLRSDEGNHLLGEPAREPLNFRARHFGGITRNAALGSPVRQARQRAFPAHPHGQRGYLPQRHVGMIAQPALGGAEREVMLHAVAGKNFGGTIVEANGQRDDHGALGKFEAVAMTPGNLQVVGNDVKLPAGHVESGMLVNFHDESSQADLPELCKTGLGGGVVKAPSAKLQAPEKLYAPSFSI